MATNLRLSTEANAALRAEAQRTGRSQQDILREAVDEHIAGVPSQPATAAQLFKSGRLRPPRHEYRRVRPTIKLSDGVTGLDLLDRDDRV